MKSKEERDSGICFMIFIVAIIVILSFAWWIVMVFK